MSLPQRPIAFVLAASNHGTMILNRNDYHMVDPAKGTGYGVGFQILANSCFDPTEVQVVLHLLNCRRHHFGKGVVAIDGGANIGVHTLEWARFMHGWGRVVAFEAQEMVYYALAGNIALNNCFNARAMLAALGQAPGELLVPEPDYHQAASFGSLELRQRQGTEFIGQAVSYAAEDCNKVPMVSVDSLEWERLDFAKFDVEGMEADVLRGAAETLARHKPVVLAEVIKSDRAELRRLLEGHGYEVHIFGMNLIALHRDDPTRANMNFGSDGSVTLMPPQ